MSLSTILEKLQEFDTPLLANTIHYIDPTPAHEFYMGGSIQSITPSLGPTVGIAVTCEADTSSPFGTPDAEGYWRLLEEIQTIPEDVIWVVKTVGSRPDHECVLGDGMAKALFAAGCVGIVTNGGVRDISGLLSIPFAAYGKGITVHHCALRFKEFGRPVEVGGIAIKPGDILHANSEGVIKVPLTCLDRLPEKAIQMRAFEHEAHCVLRQKSLAPAYKRSQLSELLLKYGFSASS